MSFDLILTLFRAVTSFLSLLYLISKLYYQKGKAKYNGYLSINSVSFKNAHTPVTFDKQEFHWIIFCLKI